MPPPPFRNTIFFNSFLVKRTYHPRRQCCWHFFSLLSSKENVNDNFEKDLVLGISFYIKNTKSKRIPPSFIVPKENDAWPQHLHGKNLGNLVTQAKSMYENKTLEPLILEKLEKLGFSLVRTNFSWDEKVFPALKIYRQLYPYPKEFLDIPVDFIVPSLNSWPENLWQLPLGLIVQSIRARKSYLNLENSEIRRAQLNELGFSWEVYHDRFQHVLLPSFQRYKEQFGDLNIPFKFVVPVDTSWPKAAHGLQLGAIASRIRREEYYIHGDPHKRKQLNDLGFVWNCAENHYTQVVYPSIAAFRHLHGHTRVPNNYIIPSTLDYPEITWGTNLGSLISGIRYSGSYVSTDPLKRIQLEKLGVRWKQQESKKFEVQWMNQLVEGLKGFQGLHGHQVVPRKFVIPHENHQAYGENLAGFKLWYCIDRARQLYRKGQLSQTCIRQLEDIGFVWKMQENQWNTRVLQPFTLYKKHYHAPQDTLGFFIPTSFVVPQSNLWPSSMWGMKLGNLAHSIRSKETYIRNHPERKTQLDQLGFLWKPKE